MSHFINGSWTQGRGDALHSLDPATGEIAWSGRAADAHDVTDAIAAANGAAAGWQALGLAGRAAILERFAESLKARRAELAETISREIGKPRWEALTEVDAMVGKVPISIDAIRKRRSDDAAQTPLGLTATRYKPHGTVAVFGPFNFPGHLPNGHIVPALLAGNTVVFKPSEQAPAVGRKTIEIWEAAGIPHGVINLLQGGRDTGRELVERAASAVAGVDGIFFTGSIAAGRAINRRMADRPDKILALELGGNAPLVVHESADPVAAAYLTVQSAFATAGQRCNCARRLIVPLGVKGDLFLEVLLRMTRSIVVGKWDAAPEPFMGPVISDAAAANVLQAQERLIQSGGRSLLPVRVVGPRTALLSPGVIDLSDVPPLPDEEIFGPLLKVIRVPNFEAAIAEANRTDFGLAAALLGGTRDDFERFYTTVKAGVVNWNRPTTAAASTLPFGGVGLSGNHRPSAYFAADYCSYAIASIEDEALRLPTTLTPGLAPSPGTPGQQ